MLVQLVIQPSLATLVAAQEKESQRFDAVVAQSRFPLELTRRIIESYLDTFEIEPNALRLRERIFSAAEFTVRLSNFLSHCAPAREIEPLVDAWMKCLNDGITSGMHLDPDKRPIACLPPWWGTTFLSWSLLGQPQVTSIAFSLAECLRNTTCSPQDASRFLKELQGLEAQSKVRNVAILMHNGFTREQVIDARRTLRPPVAPAPFSARTVTTPMAPAIVDPPAQQREARAIAPFRKPRPSTVTTPVITPKAPAKQPEPILHRYALRSNVRKLHPVIVGVVKTLRRNGFVGNNRVSIASLRNLAAKECPGELSHQQLRDALTWLARRDVITHPQGPTSLNRQPDHRLGKAMIDRVNRWIEQAT